MMDADPDSGHGVDLVDHGVTTLWDIVFELAAINDTNLSGATQPVWVDCTERLIDVQWTTGDPDLESRWPVNGAVIRCLDCSDLVGDPMSWWEPRADRFGTQCLARFGLRRSGVWHPLFSGVIDTITDEWDPQKPVRDWQIEAFDISYVLAGYRANVTASGIAGDIETAYNSIMSLIDFPFTATRFGTPVFGSWIIGGWAAEPPYDVLNKLADSGSALIHAAPSGRLEMFPWGYTTAAGSGYTVVDGYVQPDPDPLYDLPDPDTTILATRMRWVNSADRMLWRASMNSVYEPANYTSSGYNSDRYRNRFDRAGWPKPDLLNYNVSGSLPAGQPDLDGAALRSADPTRLDAFEVDTQTAGHGDQVPLDTLLSFLVAAARPARYYQVQRRLRGTDGFWDELHATQYASNVITRAGNQFRWIADIHPRWFPYA
jgi:hypothetical protein